MVNQHIGVCVVTFFPNFSMNGRAKNRRKILNHESARKYGVREILGRWEQSRICAKAKERDRLEMAARVRLGRQFMVNYGKYSLLGMAELEEPIMSLIWSIAVTW